ncbi:MAG: BON domain-containing protein [Acidobacteriia bacterium]|nr:BON domain-containing protein [Terriglobia bacterium]MYG02719.1 BON domain-containing protein [Terriglobia bacterium]MYK10901.1 BON domain-containing protein [Terriglobia bacterium]
MKCSIAKFLIPLALFAAIGVAADTHSLGRQVRHELVMLPYYSVFDNFAYQVDGSTVVLAGQVTRPTLKSGAERVVERVEGVGKVVNKIEVLPLSSSDDQIRWQVFRAIYQDSVLSRYAWQAVPPIHIVVRNGHVTLEGVVNASMEKAVANARANAVAGVFSVVNNLRVESRG